MIYSYPLFRQTVQIDIVEWLLTLQILRWFKWLRFKHFTIGLPKYKNGNWLDENICKWFKPFNGLKNGWMKIFANGSNHLDQLKMTHLLSFLEMRMTHSNSVGKQGVNYINLLICNTRFIVSLKFKGVIRLL